MEGDARAGLQARDEVHAEICARSFSAKKNAFTQHFGTEQLDASVS